VPPKVQENSRKAAYAAAAALTAIITVVTTWTFGHDAGSALRDAYIAGAVGGGLAVAALAGVCTLLLAPRFRRSASWMRAIAENELRLNSIIGSAMDAMITLDEQQKIVLFNAAAEMIFRCKATDAIGSPIERFIPEGYRSGHAAHVKHFGEAGITMRRMGGAVVLAGRRGDGEEFPIDASISHVNVGGQKFYTVILRDVTERQGASEALTRSHEELRELYQSMHEVREAERTRIARELHDELAQWLTALKMDVSWIRKHLPQHEVLLAGKADRMKTVIDNTIAAMRRIAADLRPLMLDDLGLMPAIESLLQELSDRTGMQVGLSGSDHLESLREPLVTAVYRMVQEALTNVARHAQASRVVVSLEMAQDRLSVSITDNGRGLNPDPGRKSFGLPGIRERARTLGGEARIYTAEEGGTVVAIEVPVERHVEERRA
jgi:PAS domain S-box-containing protein